ncbi:MAG: hypothetical protein ABSG25_11335 [Bryobacteraceae bacterium]|jgi:hypothetical protein
MTNRNLTRRLERLEARAAVVDQRITFVLRLVDPDGSVTESLVLEPGKPPVRIPVSVGGLHEARRLTTDNAPQRPHDGTCRRETDVSKRIGD